MRIKDFTKNSILLSLAFFSLMGCIRYYEADEMETRDVLLYDNHFLSHLNETETVILNYQQTKLLLDSLQYFENTNKPNDLCRVKISLAENLRQGGNYEAGISYLESVIQNCSEHHQMNGKAYNRLAAIYLEHSYHKQALNYLDSAIVSAKQSVEIAQKLPDTELFVNSLIIWASALNYKGNYAEAKDLLLEAMQFNEKHGTIADLSLLYNLAKNYLSQSKHDLALTTTNRYLAEAEKTGNPRSVFLGLRILADIYEATGEHALRANVINRIESTTTEKDWMIENLLLNQLLSGLEITQSQEKIANLSQERLFLISYNRLLLFFAILATFLIITVFYLLYQRNKKVVLLKEVFSLEKQADKMEADNARLQMQLKAEENNRLAAEVAAKESNLISKVLLIGKIQHFLQELLTQLKQFNLELKSARNRNNLNRIVNIVKKQVNEGPWLEFENLYASGNSAFVVNLIEKHPGLTPYEKRLCMLLQMNLTTKEISDITMQSSRAIEMARYRLRKKLNLGRDEKLSDYLAKFSLPG